MLKKLLAKLQSTKNENTVPTAPNAVSGMNALLDDLKNIFAEELLIDPRIRDFDSTTYGNGCRQRCKKIMEATMAATEKIKNHITQHQELHGEKESFDVFVNKMFANLKKSSGNLNEILSETTVDTKERQLKCYNLGMTVQQSTRALIEAYISSFNRKK